MDVIAAIGMGRARVAMRHGWRVTERHNAAIGRPSTGATTTAVISKSIGIGDVMA